MLRSGWRVSVVVVASLLGLASAADAHDRALHDDRFAHIEKIEWTWADRPVAADARLPNVLLLGDSITRGYYDPTVELLKGKANVYLFATSAAVGADALPEQIHAYAKQTPIHFSVVHLNNGMHGKTYSDAEYRARYPQFVATVKQSWPSARCIVTTTTPVRQDGPDGPTNAQIDARNAAAVRDAERAGCALDDQHALMLLHQDLHDGDIHYTAEGSKLQAEQVAASITRLLSVSR